MKQYISERDKILIMSILDSIDKILSYCQDFLNLDQFSANFQAFDATVMNFIVIGEMVNKISYELRDCAVQIDWQNIIGLRNIIAHDYFGIDAQEIWEIVTNDIIIFKQQLTDLMKNT